MSEPVGNAHVDDFDLPLSSSESTEPVNNGGGGSGQQAPKETPQDQQSDFPPDLIEAMRRENMITLPGETATSAYSRLVAHLDGKSKARGRELKKLEQRQEERFNELKSHFEPIIRRHYQEERRAAIEEQAAKIPPKDSPEYQVWLNEEILRRDDERREQERRNQNETQRTAAEQDLQRRLSDIDESGYEKVAQGLGLVQGVEADPEFSAAYDLFTESAVHAARDYFPDATDEQLQDFVGLSQQLDIRRAELNGYDIRDVMKRRYNTIIDRLVAGGLVTRVVKGSDGSQPEQKQTAAPVSKPAPKTVVERVAADSAATARRATSAVPSVTRPSAAAGSLPDPKDMDEDDYVNAVMSGVLGSEEQRASSHRKQR